MAIANGACVSFRNQPKAHFGLPWVRPWDNRVTWMKRGFNAGQMHNSMYPCILTFTSYSEILVGNCNFFLPSYI